MKRVTEFTDDVPDEKRGYWQVSDKTPKEIIQAFTEGCERDDCHVSAKYAGGTLLATSSWYDKEGQLQIRDDNTMECYLCCGKCWKMKKAKSWVE